MKARLILVSGVPSVGKTKFSKALAKKLKATYVNIGEIALKKGFIKDFDSKRDTYIVDFKKLKAWLNSFLKHTKGLIILDGYYTPYIASKTQVKKVFILRCHPIILKKRLEVKGYSSEKVLENVVAELLDASLFEALKCYRKNSLNKICELNASKRGISSLINEALRNLKKRRGVFGEVDWIKELNKEGKLKQFLELIKGVKVNEFYGDSMH
ncbi:AAA family ATPase [Candidatus Bathyarchaeota archaeon]|nr:AAA family ATPase [Candidatus Bathyarchaeota archaeon]